MAFSRAQHWPVAVAFTLVVIITTSTACNRKGKLPMTDHVWLGPTHGCTSLFPDSPNARPPVLCWGANESGQIGDGTTTPRNIAQPIDFGGGVTQLSLGEHHACGVFDQRVVRCWGDDDKGQLGTDVKNESRKKKSLVPIEIEGTRSDKGSGGILEVHVGKAHTCVRTSKTSVRCFGDNSEGQANPGWSGLNVDAEVRAFATGETHTCIAWSHPSDPAKSSVGCSGLPAVAPPGRVLEGVDIRAIVAGRAHTCALLKNGTVKCFGLNDYGQLGDGTNVASATPPVNAIGVGGADQISAGTNHTCVHLVNGTIACWGDNRHHQLANGTTTSSSHAAVIVGLVQVKELACAGDGCCARMDDRSLRCWGVNDRYQLGNGSTVEQSVPMPVKFH